MASIKVGYFVKEAATNLRRNKLMTIAAMLTAAVSLLLLGGVLTLGSFVNGITGKIQHEVEVQVFLKDSITQAQRQDIRTTLTDLDAVRSVSLVTKDQAYKEFKDLYKDQPALWQNIDANVLPESFRVQMSDPNRVEIIKSKLANNPAIDEIVDQRDTVKRLLSFTDLLRTFSLIMIVVLLGAAILLISNTTQLAIYARRREIEIMKLVGATNWFVRLPFMLEGITAGAVGALIALVLLGSVKVLAKKAIPIWIPHAGLNGVAPSQIVWLALVGIIVGAAGSAVAVRRFLEV